MKSLVLLASMTFSLSLLAKEVLYLNTLFAHVYESPSVNSASLTAIQCAHPVRILSKNKDLKGWHQVGVADHKGFINQGYLSKSKPVCFQEKYPRFFDKLNLDLSQIYYWARLNDKIVKGELITP